MAKYHITQNGRAAECKATTRPCPLGGEHFESMEAAADATFRQEMGAAPPTASWKAGAVVVRELPQGVLTADHKATLPAGRYFLGDPCYTAGKDDTAWQQWVDVADATSEGFRRPIVGATYNGHPVVASSTAHGDGSYMGSDGVEYSVDAGIIGAVPEAVIRGMKLTDADLVGSGSWVEVDGPTELEYDTDSGTIYFGPVAIHTGDEEEEEEEWYGEEAWEDADQ